MKSLPFFLSLTLPLAAARENLLRNGSFEGGTLYWHQVDAPDRMLVKDGKVGEYSLRIGKGNVMSAPFVAERGQPMTVSFFVKGEKPGRVGVQMPPSAREVGTKAKRLWMRESEQSAEIGTEWQRVSFTWLADVPADGFWPNPHYLVQIGGYDQPLLIDGVTVTVGKDGTPDYVPRREIEVVAGCGNLTSWDGAAGNAFGKGATARMIAHVSNPGSVAKEVRVQWQLIDYEGENAVGPPVSQTVTIPAGRTYTATTPIPLTRNGFVFARLSVFDGNSRLIDKSDFPLTSIPYPKAATKPDFRERFGGSFAGSRMMLEKYQRLGFGWTRWFPETKWQFFQPKKGDAFNWHDAEFDLAAQHGVSPHIVLYGWPEGLMDKEHSGNPLPLDMRWGPGDARWDDLNTETAWDRFVKAAALHFKGRSIIFEIENEPGFDGWDNFQTEYAKFTIRTAKLIRATDPQAKIMVNNVYGVPERLNAVFFEAGGLKHIDVISWHDYHQGWLSDANGIKRMRQNMDEAGGKNVELWFNEGWAYTNTAVDEPIACTDLTAAQSTNAQACSVAEMTVTGQEKTILFHTGYEDHGQSFWDYSGPGTLLWDWYGYPLPLVAMWNVYNHHIGISDEVGFIRPPGANFTIFQDLRNAKGVMIAYADRESKSDVSVELPDFGAPVFAEDIMGNISPAPRTLVLSKTGRPVILYTGKKTPGRDFLAKLEPLDRKHTAFVSGGGETFKLPLTWEGQEKGSSAGNPMGAANKPVWRLDQVWPDDPVMVSNYVPLRWAGTRWEPAANGAGGQPAVTVEGGDIEFSVRGSWSGNEGQRIAGLVFIAPESGIYHLTGKAATKPWTGGAEKFKLGIFKKDTQRSARQAVIELPKSGEPVAVDLKVDLAAGHELVLLPLMPDWHNATNTKVSELRISKFGAP